MNLSRLLLAAICLAAIACGGGSSYSSSNDACQGATLTATCTSCPAGGTALRYTGGTPADFGQNFMASYCTRCHASTVTGAARNGAPAQANFDDLATIRGHAQLIDGLAGSGSGGTFTAMPPGAPAPTAAQRALLSQWLACGAP